MTMPSVIPMIEDNAVVDTLEILPVTKIHDEDRNPSAAEVMATEILATMIPAETMDEVETTTTTTKREGTDILPTGERNLAAVVRAGVDVVEVEEGEEGAEENSNNNNSNSNENDRQHHPWILGQHISPVGIPTRIPCV